MWMMLSSFHGVLTECRVSCILWIKNRRVKVTTEKARRFGTCSTHTQPSVDGLCRCVCLCIINAGLNWSYSTVVFHVLHMNICFTIPHLSSISSSVELFLNLINKIKFDKIFRSHFTCTQYDMHFLMSITCTLPWKSERYVMYLYGECVNDISHYYNRKCR